MNFVWLLGLFCLSAVAANPRNNDFIKMNSKRKYCGSQLADMLSLVCQGVYNEYFNNSKKDLRFEDFSNEDYAYDQEEPSWPFLSERTASALIGAKAGQGYAQRRFRRGIYNECCRKSCSMNELKSYCGSGSK